MDRRETVFALAALGAAPLSARAQQSKAMPVIGWLHPGFPGMPGTNPAVAAAAKSLRLNGFINGETIKMEYRWAQGQPDSLLLQNLYA